MGCEVALLTRRLGHNRLDRRVNSEQALRVCVCVYYIYESQAISLSLSLSLFCVEILMYNVSLTHSCLYVYK